MPEHPFELAGSVEARTELVTNKIAEVKGDKEGEAAKGAPKLASAKQGLTVETEVREYFSDIPVMANIAWCESKFRHAGAQGVIRGEINRSDLGVMQINEYYHGDTAASLGINIYSLSGNLDYARYLYEREGTRPWNSSRQCWGHIAVR